MALRPTNGLKAEEVYEEVKKIADGLGITIKVLGNINNNSQLTIEGDGGGMALENALSKIKEKFIKIYTISF